MCKRLIIIGAGGHGRVVADIALKMGYKKIAFLDDALTGSCLDFPIVGKSTDIPKFVDDGTEFVIAVGNNDIRKKIAQMYDVVWAILIHPASHIGTKVHIGDGTVVMAGAVVNPCAAIGRHCIVNSSVVVEHDNVICDYVHLSPKVALGGTVKVGEGTHIGIGATVKNNINICDNCIVGAGAVVVKDIDNSCTVVGCPAHVFEH